MIDLICALPIRRSFPVAIPAGVRDATTFDYDLGTIGIPDTILHVLLRVRGHVAGCAPAVEVQNWITGTFSVSLQSRGANGMAC